MMIFLYYFVQILLLLVLSYFETHFHMGKILRKAKINSVLECSVSCPSSVLLADISGNPGLWFGRDLIFIFGFDPSAIYLRSNDKQTTRQEQYKSTCFRQHLEKGRSGGGFPLNCLFLFHSKQYVNMLYTFIIWFHNFCWNIIIHCFCWIKPVINKILLLNTISLHNWEKCVQIP